MMKRLVWAALFLLLSALICGAQAEDACTHDWSVISTVPGTCTAEGTETRKCGLCGAETSSSLPRTEHNYAGAQWVTQTPASCTSSGMNIKPCVVCGGEPAYREIPANGHDWQTSTQASTCTQPGATTRKCGSCGATQTESIPAKGHSEVTDAGYAASCTGGGLSEGRHCSVCGVVTRAQQAIPAQGHRMTRSSGASPTCTEPGKEPGETCADCGYSVAGAVIPAAGHKETGAGNAKSPTCTETGLTESKVCSVCGVTISGRKTIAAKGHRAEALPAKAPTAQEDGCTAGAQCTVCGEIIAAQESIPALKDFAAIWQMTERMAWAGGADAAQAEWQGETLVISLPQGEEKAVLGMAACTDQTLAAFYIATILNEAPVPDWRAILQTENAMTALETDANYGGFLRAARALLMEMDAALTAEEADVWLAEILRNATETQIDFSMLFAAFVQGDTQLPMTEKNGCACCLVSDGVNIALMLRPDMK